MAMEGTIVVNPENNSNAAGAIQKKRLKPVSMEIFHQVAGLPAF